MKASRSSVGRGVLTMEEGTRQPAKPAPALSAYKPPYMRWFEGDFWADRTVIRMTPQQRHYYRALLLAAFQCDSRPNLPDDDAQLWILADAPDIEAWKENRETVLCKFMTTTDAQGRKVLANKRLSEEWVFATAKAERARRNSPHPKGGQVEADSDSTRTQVGPHSERSRTQSQNQSQSQSENHKASSSPEGDGECPGFDEFWKAYPRKVGKGAALKAWRRINPGPDLQTKILAAVEGQKQTDQWSRDGGRFIPHSSTWLNRLGWEDEIQIQIEGGSFNERSGGIKP